MSILYDFINPFRTLCMAIDEVIFSLLDNAYNLFIELASAEFLTHDTIEIMMRNLYILFGIVAFFRLAVVLVNSIIDPDKLNEKGKGLSNIFFRVVAMIVILAVTPMLFSFSYEIQKMIVGKDNEITGKSTGNNVIFQVFLGDNANLGSGSGYDGGKALRNIVLSTLITIDDRYLVNNGAVCTYDEEGNVKDSSGNTIDITDENQTSCGFIPATCVGEGDTCTMQGGYIYNGKTCTWKSCKNAVAAYNEMYVNEDMNLAVISPYAGADSKLPILDSNGKETDEKDTVYVLNYMYIITAIVGIAMIWILISFTIDIAVRIFELIVLEITAPLFIATFVDPKSSQSGPFKNWLTNVGKSYASLYIKLIIFALMTLFIMLLNQTEMFNNMGDLSGWAKLFVVIGILIFAKKAPKWISEMLGIKGEGLGGLSIGKKLGGMFLAGGLATKGLEASKKAIGNKAKRIGSGMVNRIGADIGGTLSGISAATRNALGDKSLRNIRANKMDETGSKLKANAAVFKSMFSKDDIQERRDRIKDARANGSLDLKAAGKEARMYARAEATNAALNGKFKSAGALSKSVQSKFDPNYKTHDERLQADAAARLYANQGAFNLAEINRQKKIQDDIAESSRIFGHRTYANDKGDIFLDEALTQPAIYNEKTLKKYIGDHATNYQDLGMGVAFGKDANVVLTDSEKKLTINDNGTLKELSVPAGTLLQEKIVEKDGKKIISYEALTKNGEFKDNNGNNVNVQLGNSGNVRTTANGYEIVDKSGKVILKANQVKDSTGNVIGVDFANASGATQYEVKDSQGNVIKTVAYDVSKIMEEYGMKFVGKDINGDIKKDSVLAKQLDAAFASMIEKNATSIIEFEADISSIKKRKIDLQSKYVQLQEQILQVNNNTEYGKIQSKLENIAYSKQQLTDKLQQFTTWIDSMNQSGNDTIEIGDFKYTKDELNELQNNTLKTLRELDSEQYSLETWINNNPNEKIKHDNLISNLNKSLETIETSLADADADIASMEIEKDKISKAVAPLTFEGTEVNSISYGNMKEKISKNVEKFKKIAEGAIGEVPSNNSQE